MRVDVDELDPDLPMKDARSKLDAFGALQLRKQNSLLVIFSWKSDTSPSLLRHG